MAHLAMHVYRSEPVAHFNARGVDDGTIIFNVQKLISMFLHTLTSTVFLKCRGDAPIEVYLCTVTSRCKVKGERPCHRTSLATICS